MFMLRISASTDWKSHPSLHILQTRALKSDHAKFALIFKKTIFSLGF